MSTPATFGWPAIVRIGVVQAALGAIVVLTTSLINRIMVVELALAASIPGALIALHYALQILRPRWGHASDGGARRTPYVLAGMAILATGGTLAGLATAVLASDFALGLALAVGAFVLIGVGVGMGGTALLTLLAERVEDRRRGPAAALVWSMMIAGFVVTTVAVSIAIDPFSYRRLVWASGAVSLVALLATWLAMRGLEPRGEALPQTARPPFREAFTRVWADREARVFTGFVFASMLAYSMQDLILEPFAGSVFGLSPAGTTALTSLQNGATLVGMGLAAWAARQAGGSARALRVITFAGCVLSASALVSLAVTGLTGLEAGLRPALGALGLGNGIFAASAIALMMALAKGGEGAGVRMGVWGAAQAVAFGSGGFAGAVLFDLGSRLWARPVEAYGAVFLLEAALFVAAPLLVWRIGALFAPQGKAVGHG